MHTLLFVGFGGAIGAIARYIINVSFSHNGQQFPWATFIANISGAFLIGVLYVALLEKPVFNPALSESLRQLLVVGFLGALTTFSSFSLESIALFNNNLYQTAIVYIVATLICCLALTFIAIKIGRLIL